MPGHGPRESHQGEGGVAIDVVSLGDLVPWLGCWRGVVGPSGGLLASWWWCARRELVELVGTGGGCISLAALAPDFAEMDSTDPDRAGRLGQAGGRLVVGAVGAGGAVRPDFPDRGAGTKDLGRGAKNCPSGVSMGYSLLSVYLRIRY